MGTFWWREAFITYLLPLTRNSQTTRHVNCQAGWLLKHCGGGSGWRASVLQRCSWDISHHWKYHGWLQIGRTWCNFGFASDDAPGLLPLTSDDWMAWLFVWSGRGECSLSATWAHVGLGSCQGDKAVAALAICLWHHQYSMALPPVSFRWWRVGYTCGRNQMKTISRAGAWWAYRIVTPNLFGGKWGGAYRIWRKVALYKEPGADSWEAKVTPPMPPSPQEIRP